MALTDESNNMVMPVAPMYGGGNGFDNAFGGNSWWILLLFILLGNGGLWGNGFGCGGNGLATDSAVMYPWMNQAEMMNAGFRNQSVDGQLTGIQSSVNNLSTQVGNGFNTLQGSVNSGFNSVTAGMNAGFANAETSANARQMANMQQAFAAQTAMSGGFNSLSSQLASCCCDQRLGTADLKYTIATENCTDRTALSDGIRDVIATDTANTQAMLNAIKGISDQMCQDKIEQKNDIIAQLRSELMYARGQASQDVQTAAIQAGQRALANEVEQYVLPTPRPAYVVQNPNCCVQNGCGCGSF